MFDFACTGEVHGRALAAGQNDPGFDRASYSFAEDVVGWRLYAIAGAGRDEGSGGQPGRSDLEAQRSAIAAALPATGSAAPIPK